MGILGPQKPLFPMVEGHIANFRIFLDIFEFFCFVYIFCLKKKRFFGILGSPYCSIGATISIGQEMLFLPYAGFFSVKVQGNERTKFFFVLF